MRNYIMLDIETVPTEIKHEDIKNYLMDKKISREARSLDPNYSKIINIGLKPLNQETIIFFGDEKHILEELWKFLSNNSGSVVVTHNGYGFDVPFLILRSCVNKVRITVDINTNKWNMKNSNHFDTMQFFSHYGTFINPNLEILGKMNNVDINKPRVTGSEVERLYKEGKFEEIQEHCRQDLEILERVFKELCMSYFERT